MMAEGEALNDKMEFRERFEGMTPEARMFALAELVYDTNIATVKIDKKLDGVCDKSDDHDKRIATLETTAGISNKKLITTGGLSGILSAALATFLTWISTRGGQ
jgi:hypothetical protein